MDKIERLQFLNKEIDIYNQIIQLALDLDPTIARDRIVNEAIEERNSKRRILSFIVEH